LSDGRSTISPNVNFATFAVRNEDNGCVPSSSKACRFTIESIGVELGAFFFADTFVEKFVITNLRPFVVSAKPSASIPADTLFHVATTAFFDPSLEEATTETRTVSAINPSGQGTISLGGTLKKKIGSITYTTTFSVSADTPLFNRPPVANAGKDFSISGFECESSPFLDLSNSFDPDGNLSYFTLAVDGSFVGYGFIDGVTDFFLLRHQGSNIVTVTAVDELGAEATDTVKITANCPSLPKAP
jgi:hypothetical protein